MRYRDTFIASPASDTVFLLGVPLITLGGVLLLLHFNVVTLAVFVGFTAIYTGAHHLPGLLRAYGTREVFENNRARLILAPALIFSLVLFLEVKGLRAYIVVLWFFNWWHTAMQNYGLMRIYERKTLTPVSYSAKLDLISIIVWHFTASELLSDDMRFELAKHLYNLRVGNAALVSGLLTALLWLGIGASIVLLVLYARNFITQFRANAVVAINKQLFLVVTYGVYLYMFRHFTEDISTSVESFYHNTQYIFFVWIIQRRLAERGDTSAKTQFNWFGSLFSLKNQIAAVIAYAGAVVGWGYLMGGSIKPRIHTESIVPMFNTFYATAAFLHYYTDSFIWKARTREMSSALGLKGAGLELRPRSYVFSFAELSAWILVPIVVTTALTNPKNIGHNGVRDNAGLAAFSADLLKDREHWSQAAVAANDIADFFAAGDDTSHALQWYRRAVEARPDYADAYQALGHLYSEEGNAIEAATAYEKAVALDPSFKSSFNNLGNAYALIGDFEKSRAAYERAVALDPRFLDAQLNLASLYASRGELNSARSMYERVLRSDPNSLEAVRSLGEVAAREGRFDDADRYFRRAVELAPQDKQNHMILARYQFSRGNLMEAKTHLESGMDPSDAEGYLLKSQILMGLNKPADAADVLEQGVRAVPANAELEGNLGSVYLKVGRPDEAEKHLQEAIRLDPNFSDAYEALADIWEKRDSAIARMYRNHVRK